MTTGFLQKIFGSRNQRLVKQYQKTVAAINALEPQIEQLTDDQLRAKTGEFRQRVASGESLDKLLPEAFAVCREASKRVLKMRHFDVQLIGGMVLHYGKIARNAHRRRQDAGRDAAGLPECAVRARRARRDGERLPCAARRRMDGRVCTTSSACRSASTCRRWTTARSRQAYAADITYGTNNEFGFDYLRDNMVYETDARVQRALNFAIVDEVDSILIDEARTPLIISGQAEDHTELYVRMNALPPLLERQIGEEKADGTGVEKPGDYTLDEKARQVFLTE